MVLYTCQSYFGSPETPFTTPHHNPLRDAPRSERPNFMRMNNNPRYANGNRRRKNRQRMKAIGGECGICRGRFGPIHYDEPSDPQHPLSFVIDEIHPVSRYREFGYSSAREAAEDWSNLQPAHYYCNQTKGAKVNFTLEVGKCERKDEIKLNISDGEW